MQNISNVGICICWYEGPQIIVLANFARRLQDIQFTSQVRFVTWFYFWCLKHLRHFPDIWGSSQFYLDFLSNIISISHQIIFLNLEFVMYQFRFFNTKFFSIYSRKFQVSPMFPRHLCIIMIFHWFYFSHYCIQFSKFFQNKKMNTSQWKS